ncbi:thioredoxin family protein [Roseivirga sp.]|uniref:thioredoxin family protein n=1 Tax=Roseivirga sp. TaxID=1964215 RepID=UPI003B5286B5
MRSLLFICLSILLNSTAHAQIDWHDDFGEAKEAARAQGKLILIDFWAHWCGPCAKMDLDLWSSEEMEEISDNFIGYKLDVDLETFLAIKFNVRGIPRVMIVTVDEQILWDRTGYAGPEQFLSAIESLPTNLKEYYEAFSLAEENNSDQALYDLGIAYQKMGREVNHASISNKLFSLSNKYLRQSAKGKDAIIAELSDLNMILNLAYEGHSKKALKKIEKIDDNQSDIIKEFVKYIQAFCYKCEGLDKEFQQVKKEMTDKTLIAELDKNN